MVQPFTKVTYPIPHDDSGGCLFVYGNADAPHLVIMCAGFPDDQSVFQPLASRIASSCNCLVGVGCIPGYDEEKKQEQWKDGYSFEDWVACLREAVKALRAQAKDNNAKLTGIFHDWGCVAGLMYTNRSLQEGLRELIPDQLVLLDILLGPHPKTKDKPRVVIPKLTQFHTTMSLIIYQLALAKTWFLQRYVSQHLALAYLSISTVVLKVLRLLPGSDADSPHILPKTSRKAFKILYMTYPYYIAWKAILTGNARSTFRSAYLPLDLNRTPILFLWGASKHFQLHSFKAVALLERENKNGGRSRVVRVENAGHWLYLQQEDLCFEKIKTFLQELVRTSRSSSHL
jgi:pimeloyl-ACP methyl ester carboxylesterase